MATVKKKNTWLKEGSFIRLSSDKSLPGGYKLSNSTYKVYTALMSQSNTDDPVVIVLENTIGNIVWTRQSEGVYQGTLAGAFTPNKTVCFLTTGGYEGSNVYETSFTRASGSDSVVSMQLAGYNGVNTDLLDNGVYEASLEIRVYN